MKYHNYEELIENNRAWVEQKLGLDAHYFEQLSKPQKPPFLYIGCSDSRMPIDTMTRTEPGEMFIHRNIANQVSVNDINLLSVLEFAVETLQVKHIIVCGHYGCGGVEAAFNGASEGLVANWVTPIRDIFLRHKNEIDSIEVRSRKLDRLSELNVLQQVENICKTSILHKAFQRNSFPRIHGWVLDIYHGQIKELELPLSVWKERGLVPSAF